MISNTSVHDVGSLDRQTVTSGETSPLFLCDEAAGKVAGVTGRTIRNWRKRGLPSSKVGRCRRTALADLVAFMQRHVEKEGGKR